MFGGHAHMAIRSHSVCRLVLRSCGRGCFKLPQLQTLHRRSIVLASSSLTNPEQLLQADQVSPFEKTLQNTELHEYRVRQLLYRSRQRGWLELDLIMGSWADQHLSALNPKQLVEYEVIVRQENPDLVKWVINGDEAPLEIQQNPYYQALRAYTLGDGKKWIIRKGNQ